MNHIKQTIRTATCSAFILALAAIANTPAFAVTAVAAADDKSITVDGDGPDANVIGAPAENKKKPGKKSDASSTVSAAYEIDGKTDKKELVVSNKHLSTSKKNESVVGAFNNAQLTLRNIIMEKSGDTSNEDSSAFYGVNAALVATKGSTVDVDNCTITTDAEGANAVFATGTDSKITMHTVKIRTSQNGSRGLDSTYGGTVVAYDADIVTQGAHSAALANDRGGGTTAVNRGTLNTYGEGSPVFYSTGDITAKDVVGYSEASEIGVVEGKNSMTITGGSYVNKGTNAFMLYQSTSGDADEGTAMFTAKDASFSLQGKGSFFYITNTDAEAELTNCTIEGKTASTKNSKNFVLVNAAGNNSERGWGKRGHNGATFRLTLSDMSASGSVNCDAISTVSLTLEDGASYTGAIDAEKKGAVSVTMSSNAKWTLAADSYVSAFSDENKKYTNIKSNGYNVYYDKTASENKSLKGKSYTLPGGGKLKPYTPSKNTTSSYDDDYDDDDYYNDDDHSNGTHNGDWGTDINVTD